MDKSAELARVVFDNDVPFGVSSDECVAPADTDVGDAQVTVVASSHFDCVFVIQIDDMEHLAGICLTVLLRRKLGAF